ncbi:MAG: gamma-glutamyltransferase [Gemmatimonadota bacterium]
MSRIALAVILGTSLSGVTACGRTPAAAPTPAATAATAATAADAGAAALTPDARPIRPEANGMNGAVVSEHPLATAAGYQVLRAGGNAVDAAVTMAAVLAVVRPHMNGVGGDAFGLFYDADSRAVTALNGSGRAAAAATPAFFAEQGIERMPGSGPLSVTVPGAVSAWAAALERHGTISLSEALAPAIQVAEEGFVVSATLAEDLGGARRLNEGGQAIYRPGDRRLQPGDVLRSPALAATLRRLAAEGPGALYGGQVGASVVDFLRERGSPLQLSDFAAHEVTWTEPATVSFRGHRVHTMPPNSQGTVLLQMLGMAETLPLEERAPGSAEFLHELIEIKKLAFADRDRWIADPEHAEVPLDRLLDPAYLRARAALVGPAAAEERAPGFGGSTTNGQDGAAFDDGDTIYTMAVDRWGNAVSWIQSLFSSLGSGLVDPATGIVLQNRGAGFTLEAGHPNRIAPGKRPFHTLMPAMVTGADGSFVMTLGTPGGHGQSQSLLQTLIPIVVHGLGPQLAVEAPRFRSESGTRVLVEDRLGAGTLAALEARGHRLDVSSGWTATFGSVQIIHRLPSGVLRAGADMRREAAALAY